MEFVIVGLGNPGKRYALTRHNLGALVVEAYAKKQGWSFKEKEEFQSLVVKESIKSLKNNELQEVKIHLLLPMTYMNLSGTAVAKYLNYYKLAPSNVIVVCDDIALDFGILRVRNVGGSGGHNGLKDIEGKLHTKHYVRLRMGIGRQNEKQQVLADYVLDSFNEEEKKLLENFLEEGIRVLNGLIVNPVTVVMNAVNAKQKKVIDS